MKSSLKHRSAHSHKESKKLCQHISLDNKSKHANSVNSEHLSHADCNTVYDIQRKYSKTDLHLQSTVTFSLTQLNYSALFFHITLLRMFNLFLCIFMAKSLVYCCHLMENAGNTDIFLTYSLIKRDLTHSALIIFLWYEPLPAY